ncbi:MAG: hypothetical protein SD837_00080 [Candidatus Electrothrix scaldis]|nr:MAG: hypothetical protein SD837_00080 [Candidatus Electrothrix sp. GW3-3]
MKIAFDLDDTLIPTRQPFSSGSRRLGFPLGLAYKEKLRTGAVELLQGLAAEHEVWIYTTSLRGTLYLKTWFSLWGIKLAGIVNKQVHDKRVVGSKFSDFSKAPALFGISVLIDDLPGVQIECEHQGSHAIIIAPSDDDWTRIVREELKNIEKRTS